MTLYEGSLFDLLQHANPRRNLSCKQIARVAIHILSALSILHSRRIVHRDVKSPNVMYEGDPNDFDNLHFFLGDFGEAKVALAPQSPKRLSFSGTGPWIAPEVYQSKSYSVEADIWSFGMLLFELMTSRIPYGSRSKAEMESLILDSKLPKLKEKKAAQYVSILPIWRDCLQFDPKERLTAAKALMGFEKIIF